MIYILYVLILYLLAKVFLKHQVEHVIVIYNTLNRLILVLVWTEWNLMDRISDGIDVWLAEWECYT
jgi:hypothetical protein